MHIYRCRFRKAEVKRREEEVREWETVAQKLNCELSSERKLRSEAEQEVSRTRVGLVKAHKEIQIKGISFLGKNYSTYKSRLRWPCLLSPRSRLRKYK